MSTRAGRSLALRTRVAVAACVGATLVAGVAAALLAAVLVREQNSDLNRRVTAVSAVLSPVLVRAAERPGAGLLSDALAQRLAIALDAPYVGTVSRGGAQVAFISQSGADPALPQLPAGLHNVTIDSQQYLVLTHSASGGTLSVSVGLSRAETDNRAHRIEKYALFVLVLAALLSAGVGWLLAGPAVGPLRTLRERTQAIDGSGRLPPGVRLDDVHGAREAEELAAALSGLLSRVETARGESEQALAAARAFASSAGHELRTPLTAMRTDLDVLTSYPDLTGAARQEILADLHHGQRRVESTLAALGQLAAGDLADRSGFGPVDIAELVYAAAAEINRSDGPQPPVVVAVAETELSTSGSADGLRLAVDNLLRNAVVHGRPSRITVSAERTKTGIRIMVDDDGPGVPATERSAVFGRFVRGSAAATAGSGIGLALVAQQAALHGGTAYLTESPFGGARAVVELAAR